MKKFIVLVVMLFLLCGCSDINKLNYDDIINEAISSKFNLHNEYRTGYKYYTPSGISVINSDEYNEILGSGKYNYYFYIDVVSYYNRVIDSYEVNPNAYYSEVINYQDKYGYIEINSLGTDRYLLEIMYNYAKMEVIVDKEYLNGAVNNAIITLSSVSYNNDILENLVGENVLTSKEIEFNIFETKKTESNFLEVESNNIYVDDTEEDPDLIN